MRSTGEVMARGDSFEEALLKGFRCAGHPIKVPFWVLLSLSPWSRAEALDAVGILSRAGCAIYCTPGTASFFMSKGIACDVVSPEDALELAGEGVKLVVNTVSPGWGSGYGFKLRRRAMERGVLCLTSCDTLKGLAEALVFRGDLGEALASGERWYNL
jgi:carbamoyl-phosphate synthase large subunit